MQSESFKKRSLIYHHLRVEEQPGYGKISRYIMIDISISTSHLTLWNLWKGRTTKISVGPSAQLELQATGDAILGKVGDHCNEVGVWKILERMLFFWGKVWKIPQILSNFVIFLLAVCWNLTKVIQKKNWWKLVSKVILLITSTLAKSHQQNNQKNCLNFWLLKWQLPCLSMWNGYHLDVSWNSKFPEFLLVSKFQSPTSKWRGKSGGEPGSSEGVGPAGGQVIGSGKTVDIDLMIANGSITQMYLYIFDYNLLMFFVWWWPWNAFSSEKMQQ